MSALSPSPASFSATAPPSITIPPPQLSSPAPDFSTSPPPSPSLNPATPSAPPPAEQPLPSPLTPSPSPQSSVREISPPPASIGPEDSAPAPVTPAGDSPPALSSVPPHSSPPYSASTTPRSHVPPPPRISSPDSDSTRPPTFGVAPPSTQSSGPGSNGRNGSGGAVAIGLVAGVLLLGFIGIAICCLRRQKKRVSENGGFVLPKLSSPIASSPESDPALFKTHSSAPLIQRAFEGDNVCTTSRLGNSRTRSWCTYEELVKATNNFSIQNLLGEGGFGSVYKGHLPCGKQVAVKQLKIERGQGEREFKAEVEIISRIHHRHLVSLVGYCISDDRRLLVYDYVPNNTLYFHLHGDGRPVLEWANRVKIAAGVARGIAYLHEDCNPQIIHRDIKSSNILLDYNFEARVSDFGLAKLALDANKHVTTRVMGTFGYVAPEYVSSGKVTEKSDVYSFGVMLLELITGRKSVDICQPVGEESLVEWARPLLSHALDIDELDNLTDPKLGKNYDESEMFCMIEVAAACVRYSSSERPRMRQVFRAFDSLASSDLTNGMKVGESEASDSEELRLFTRMAFGCEDYSSGCFSQISLNT